MPLLSIAENIFLGNEPARVRRDRLVRGATPRRSELLRKVGLERVARATLITDLGVGKQQLVEIAKALSKEVKLLILDEPTASLNETDSDALLDLLLELKAQGITCILISHKLNEIAKVADSITVLRDGAHRRDARLPRRRRSARTAIIRGMVGRDDGRPLPEAHAADRRDACSRCATGACTTRCTPTALVDQGRRTCMSGAARSSASPA